MQGTWVRALVWAHAPQLLSLCSGAQEPQLLSLCTTTTEARKPRACAPQRREATARRGPHTAARSGPRSLQLERADMQQRRPNAAKRKKKKNHESCIVAQ